jgi:hypothetical protein
MAGSVGTSGGAEGVPETAALRRVLGELVELDPAELDDDTLDALSVDLMRCRSLLEVATGRVVGAWRDREVFRSDGSRSAKARLARDAGCAPAAAGRVVNLAGDLASMPATVAAVAAGELSIDHASVLARANALHRRELFARDEAMLVAKGTDTTPGRALSHDQFVQAVRYWIWVADDESREVDPEAEARRQHEAESLTMAQTFDGGGDVQIHLDAVDFDIFSTAIMRREQDLFAAECAAARAAAGLGPDDELTLEAMAGLRTAAQRRADAMISLVTDGQAMPPGSVKPRPLFSALVGLSDLVGPIRESFNGTVFTPGQLARHLSEADVERIVFEPPNRVIEVSRTARFFTGGIRRAIEVRDRHCQFPGCTVPAELCQADHIVEVTDGGPTVQENGRLLCPAHNRQRPGRRSGGPPLADTG